MNKRTLVVLWIIVGVLGFVIGYKLTDYINVRYGFNMVSIKVLELDARVDELERKIEELDNSSNNFIYKDDITENTPITIEHEDALLEYDVSDKMYDNIYYFIDTYASNNGYSKCDIIECVSDYSEGICGVSIGIIFDSDRYVCIWVDDESDDVLKIYDCQLDDNIIEFWEYI